jgi:hypothetical protein
MNITISPRKVIQVLSGMMLFFAVAGIVAYYTFHFLGRPSAHGLVPLFDLEQEANAPTWFQSSLLLLSAVLLAVIAAFKKREGDRFAIHWKVLSFGFIFLSADEASSIHEMLIAPMKSAFHLTGFLNFAWVVPYGILVLVILVSSLRFLAALPAKMRNALITAGTLYVLGAIGLEMVEGFLSFHNERNVAYMALVITEECLEMIGVLILISALLSHLSTYVKDVTVRISGEEVIPEAAISLSRRTAMDGVREPVA